MTYRALSAAIHSGWFTNFNRNARSTATLSALFALVYQPACSFAEETDATAVDLPPIVVTATRQPQVRQEIPAAIDRVDALTTRSAGPMINLSEGISKVPGVAVNNRQNYAQDLQVVSRGFGARSTFGVRGVRLYADGIPATMPDGQGQTATFNLSSASRVEVLRGPYSALYGNASGGVIQVFTADGPAQPEGSVGGWIGSDGLAREVVQAGGTSGNFNYLFDLGHFETDGWREHSAAERTQFNGKLKWSLGPRENVVAVINALRMPEAQDPLGLNRMQFDTDPRQAGTDAVRFNTRKNVDQTQVGLIWNQRLERSELSLMGYVGERSVTQFQSISVAAQTIGAGRTQSSGGVIDLERSYVGFDARYALRGAWGEQPWSLIAGLALDQMHEHRTGYENFLPTTPITLGVQGALRRDEDSIAANADPYLQAGWSPAPWLDINVGLRRNAVRISTQDHYITASNGDDSGARRFEHVVPVAGVLWRASPHLHLYGNAGQSFETPTLNEMAYKPGGGTGLNQSLEASGGQHAELGAKWTDDGAWLNFAVFRVRTHDEIGVLTNSGGRSTYQNVGRTGRSGMEANGQWQWGGAGGHAWTLYGAYTYTDATYRDPFTTCTATPCTSSNALAVAAGSAIPGVTDQLGYIELAWQPTAGLQTAVEARHVGRVFVNDLNSDRAAAYSTLAWRTSWQQRMGPLQLQLLGRLDNLQNRRYAGSVIVNESNGRYFESAPGRSWLVGAQATLTF